MEHMLINQKHDIEYWQDWFKKKVVILYQFCEWIPVAIVGGGVIGYGVAKLVVKKMVKFRKI